MSGSTFGSALRGAKHRIVPAGARQAIRHFAQATRAWQASLNLARLKGQVWSLPPGSVVRCLNYAVRINDGPNYYILFKDIFLHRIYHFEAQRPDPLILDCGSNIGMSILYFKHVYPAARIIGFEPDPLIYPYLEQNVSRNNLHDVRLVQAALSNREGTLSFLSDSNCASYVVAEAPEAVPEGWERFEVSCHRLRDYLDQPVDFLKMNIEGAEWDVLADSEDRLRQVDQMVLEYHHLPGLPRTLHEILALLDRQGFAYLINDFDSETNASVRSPFRLGPESRYFLLVYARRMDWSTSR